MTALAIGASVTVSVRDGGTVAIATNGGMASAFVSSTEGGSLPLNFGPTAERRIMGPFKEGASVVITNGSCAAFDYDVETQLDAANLAGFSMSVRQVATNCFVPERFATGLFQSINRSAHYMRGAGVQSVKLVYCNWTAAFNTFESGPGASATVNSYIEYPAGTFTPVLFNGVRQVTITNAGEATSDATPVAIPRNARFWVRTLYQCSAGIITTSVNPSTAHGEATNYAVSGFTDQSLVGTITNAANGMYAPQAIIGLSSTPAPLLFGDSRTMGQADAYTNCVFNDTGNLARSIGPQLPYIKSGTPSDSYLILATATSRAALRVSLAQRFCTHIISAYGINDVNALQTGAQAFANMLLIKALFGDMPFYQCTVSPISTSTDAWATTVNQTTAATNAERVNYNNLVRATGQVSGVFELADIVESARDSGLWAAPGYTSDGLHELQKANLFIANSARLHPGRFV